MAFLLELLLLWWTTEMSFKKLLDVAVASKYITKHIIPEMGSRPN